MKTKVGLILIVLAALAADGCSYLTAHGRAEAAYARYVRHSSAGRVKMQRKIASFPRLPAGPQVNDPQIATSTGPESVTAANVSQY
jgi:hypothetical protein